jgi:hypothetical protein
VKQNQTSCGDPNGLSESRNAIGDDVQLCCAVCGGAHLEFGEDGARCRVACVHYDNLTCNRCYDDAREARGLRRLFDGARPALCCDPELQETAAQACLMGGYVAGRLSAAEEAEALASEARGLARDVLQKLAARLRASVAGERAALTPKANAAIVAFVGEVAHG